MFIRAQKGRSFMTKLPEFPSHGCPSPGAHPPSRGRAAGMASSWASALVGAAVLHSRNRSNSSSMDWR